MKKEAGSPFVDCCAGSEKYVYMRWKGDGICVWGKSLFVCVCISITKFLQNGWTDFDVVSCITQVSLQSRFLDVSGKNQLSSYEVAPTYVMQKKPHKNRSSRFKE